MNNVQTYWRNVRQIESTLPEFPWLMSLDDPLRGMVGGCIVQANRDTAAQMIYEGRFRLATENEISAYQADCERKQQADWLNSLRRQGIALYTLPPRTQPDSPKGRQ